MRFINRIMTYCIVWLLFLPQAYGGTELEQVIQKLKISVQTRLDQELKQAVRRSESKNLVDRVRTSVAINARLLESKGYFFALARLQLISTLPLDQLNTLISAGQITITTSHNLDKSQENSLRKLVADSLNLSSEIWKVEVKNPVVKPAEGLTEQEKSAVPIRKPSGRTETASQNALSAQPITETVESLSPEQVAGQAVILDGVKDNLSKYLFMIGGLLAALGVLIAVFLRRSPGEVEYLNWQTLSNHLKGLKSEEIMYMMRLLDGEHRVLIIAALDKRQASSLLAYVYLNNRTMHRDLVQSLCEFFNNPLLIREMDAIKELTEKVDAMKRMDYIGFMQRLFQLQHLESRVKIEQQLGTAFPELSHLIKR